jgi:polar amino acid transport system substrate-binding protein
MNIKPKEKGQKLKGFLAVVALLVVIGVFFAGCTDAETNSLSEPADSVLAEGVEATADPGDLNPAASSATAGLASLRYVTEEFPPFNYREDGVPQGMAVDILADIFQQYGAGITVDVCEFLPWDEGYRAVQTGPRTVLFSTARVPGCDGSLQWAGPYAEGSIVLFAPADKYSSLPFPDDLAGLRIGAISNTSSIPYLLTNGVPVESIVTGDDAQALVGMLEAGEIDAWSTGDQSGRYFLQKYATHPDDYIPVFTLATNEYYFAFSPDTPEEIVMAFQEGICAVKK